MHSWMRTWFFPVSLAIALAFAPACSDDAVEGAAGVGSTDGASDQSKAPEAAAEAAPDDGGSPDVSISDATDAGQPDSSSEVSVSADAAPDTTPNDATKPDGAAEGGSGLVQAGTALTVKGVTADDYVIYFDNLARTYYAVPLQGGTPTLLFALPPGGNSFVNVFGKIVFLQTWGSAPTYVSQLTIWSSALGQPLPVSNSTFLQFAQTVFASEDSKSIAYIRVTNDQATVGAIYGLDADGTNSTLLVDNIALRAPLGCLPGVNFPGGGYAITTYCPLPMPDEAGTDAGSAEAGSADASPPPAPTHAIQAFSLANHWASTLVVPNSIATFAVDPASDQLVTASAASNGRLQGFSLSAGSAGAVLDPDTAIGGRQFLFGGKGSPWYVAYNTDTGALKRSAVVAAPSAQTLLPSGVNYFLTSSRDGNWLVVANARNSVLAGDLSVVSSRTPNTSTLVATSSQFADRPLAVSARPGGAFTTDQKYAVFYSDAVQNRQGSWIGYVRAMPLGSPDAGAAQRLSNGYDIDVFSLAGSKVLLVDNYQEGDAGSVPTVDIDLVDPATSAAPRLIASGALGIAGIGGAVSLSSDQSKVVYSTLQSPAPGIYAAPIP